MKIGLNKFRHNFHILFFYFERLDKILEVLPYYNF